MGEGEEGYEETEACELLVEFVGGKWGCVVIVLGCGIVVVIGIVLGVFVAIVMVVFVTTVMVIFITIVIAILIITIIAIVIMILTTMLSIHRTLIHFFIIILIITTTIHQRIHRRPHIPLRQLLRRKRLE